MVFRSIFRTILIAAILVPPAIPAISQEQSASFACGTREVLDYLDNNKSPITGGSATWAAELTNPSVGIGLAGISDWTSQQPFIDVVKTARTWTGHLPNQWGGWSHEDLASRGYLDENGWPKSIPNELRSVEMLLMTDLPAEEISVKGRYRLTYEGEGSLEVTSMRQTWQARDNTVWFDAEPGNTTVGIKILRTDPQQTGDYIRNIVVVKEDNIAAYEAGAIFNPLWLKHIRDNRLIRFMDWMQTNNSTQSEWNNRPRPSDYTYTLRGAPLEIMVRLANEIGADPWFNMPHLATDEYLHCFAEAVHASLRTDLKAHVELSNEVWNWIFQQAQWADEGALARWGQKDRWVQYYAVRAMDMARIWRDAYGADSEQRLTTVLTVFTGWLGLEADIVAPSLWIAENPEQNQTAAQYFDAYSVTGYFGYSLGDGKANQVRKWISDSTEAATQKSEAEGLSGAAQVAFVAQHRFDEAIAQAAQDLKDGSVTGDPSGSLAELLGKILPHHAKVAAEHGMDLIMYEGGTHVVGIGMNQEDAGLTEFFTALNYSPEMGGLYADLLAGWKDLGGTVFTVYSDVTAPGKYGSWGALRHLDDDNPRWDAIVDFNQATPGWWEERAETSFVEQP